MIQLIIGGVVLPETSGNKYRCYPSTMAQEVDMISGRRVREIRGSVQMVEWSYDYMTDDLYRQVLGVLRSDGPITVAYLPDNGTELVTGQFWVQSIAQPTFAFSKGMKPFWHNVGFTLREVKPHD